MNNLVLADATSINQAAELLRQGRLVAFPTETVYGLGADAANAQAVAGIFAAKGRPVNHPLIVHIGAIEQLTEWASVVPDAAYQLAAQFWPGPLAMILPKQPQVPLAVTGGQQTVGLRMPNHPVALALLKQFGGGVAAPSANRFCRISPTLASHVREELGDSVDMILDGGPSQVGVESTIIDLSGTQPRLLRPGHITAEQLSTALQQDILLPQTPTESQVRAPGMMEIHYAPSTPALLCTGDVLLDTAQGLKAQGKTCAILGYRIDLPADKSFPVLRLSEQAESYARQLYAGLRTLDNLHLDVILVEQPPQNRDWQAVNDRLSKATTRLHILFRP